MFISLLITLVLGYLMWYVTLVPINITSISFWFFALVLGVLFSVIYSIYTWYKKIDVSKKKYTILFLSPWAIAVLVFLGAILSSTVLNAKKYSNMITVENGDFTKDIVQMSFTQIPVVDRVTAIKLGDRKMGEMVELASQFNVSDAYTQIDFQDKAVRVTPLEYNGFLKWLNNKKAGIPGYITVDMDSGQTRLNKLEKNIKYSKSDKFNRDIRRHIVKKYPTKIIQDISFEIDEDGIPYWIAPTYKKTIGIFGGADVNTVIVTNAATGESNEYEVSQVPTWIDRVYNADKIIEQIDNWGSLKKGYINSRFSQKGVLISTVGYNYLAIDDDVYLYTGITSASKDSSNVGFVLTNLRNKNTKFYEISSADEVSAMGSAEGEVQEKEYKSTFPILLNIDNKATYMMALKDNAELIKAYAFVDAKDYQNVSVGSTVEEALKKHGVDTKSETDSKKDEIEITIEVVEIKQVVIDGYTNYYIKANDEIYISNITVNEKLPFIKPKDKIKIKYYKDSNGLNKISNIEI